MSAKIDFLPPPFFFVRKVNDIATMADQPSATAAAASSTADDLTSKVASMTMTGNSSANDGPGDGSGGKKKKGGGNSTNSNSNSSNNSKNKQPPPPPREWTPEMQSDYDRILSVGEECISPSELRGLITAKGRGSGHEAGFNLYDGFEPSGRMHIAQVR